MTEFQIEVYRVETLFGPKWRYSIDGERSRLSYDFRWTANLGARSECRAIVREARRSKGLEYTYTVRED